MKVFYCFPGGRYKALTMSYDDGVVEDERLVQIFNENGIKGTFNINAGLIELGTRIRKERIRELYQGHEVATHGYTHATLGRCPMIEVASEILKDRTELEEITGGLVRGHAYPNGSYSEEIKDLFRKLGIAYGRVTSPHPAGGMKAYALPEDPLEWRPTCHHGDPTLMERGEWLVNYKTKQYLRLMYVWGHSYEFRKDNNWELIENFCKLVGGHEDIWYATNIEIIDYMEVLKSLRFSADGTRVYNPSVQSAWLTVELDYVAEVPGGAYVDLTEAVKFAD